jgi:hypothetical protein
MKIAQLIIFIDLKGTLASYYHKYYYSYKAHSVQNKIEIEENEIKG